MAFQPIDTTGYATDDTFAPIPIGEYLFLVSDGKLDTGKTTGEEYLSFKLKVLEGPKANRTIFHSVWCYGDDPALNKKRLDWFKSMVKAAGIVNLTDPAQLNGKIVKASVSHYTAKDGTLKDSITPWSFKEPGTAPLAPPTFQPVQASSSASSAPAPSWKQATAPSQPVADGGIKPHDDDWPEDPQF